MPHLLRTHRLPPPLMLAQLPQMLLQLPLRRLMLRLPLPTLLPRPLPTLVLLPQQKVTPLFKLKPELMLHSLMKSCHRFTEAWLPKNSSATIPLSVSNCRPRWPKTKVKPLRLLTQLPRPLRTPLLRHRLLLPPTT